MDSFIKIKSYKLPIDLDSSDFKFDGDCCTYTIVNIRTITRIEMMYVKLKGVQYYCILYFVDSEKIPPFITGGREVDIDLVGETHRIIEMFTTKKERDDRWKQLENILLL